MITGVSLVPAAAWANEHCQRLGVPIRGVEAVCEEGSEPKVEEDTVEIDGEMHELTVAFAENMIYAYIIVIIRLLTSGVGIVIALMIAVSGVQYAMAGGNSQKIEAAKTKLVHAVEALVLFIFLVAIINFLIPGGGL